MARLYGDNGKPDDTAVGQILSPYASDHSAVSDCVKLAEASFTAGKAVMIYGFQSKQRPREIPDRRVFAARLIRRRNRRPQNRESSYHSLSNASGHTVGRSYRAVSKFAPSRCAPGKPRALQLHFEEECASSCAPKRGRRRPDARAAHARGYAGPKAGNGLDGSFPDSAPEGARRYCCMRERVSMHGGSGGPSRAFTVCWRPHGRGYQPCPAAWPPGSGASPPAPARPGATHPAPRANATRRPGLIGQSAVKQAHLPRAMSSARGGRAGREPRPHAPRTTIGVILPESAWTTISPRPTRLFKLRRLCP